jgi:hypothetical protein
MEAPPEFPDDLVATFCAVTGADDGVAQRYLGAVAGDLDMAVNLYLEGGESTGTAPPAGDGPEPPPPSAIDVDAYVRAPIQPRRSVLVEDDYGRSSGAYREYQGLAAPSQPPSMGPVPSPLVEPFRDFQSETSPFLGGAGGTDERGRRLAELFRPPTEIMFTGSFEAARRRAREEHRWLLVTIHSPTEFPCQQMVRDVWNDTTIQEFVRESLLFMFVTVGTLEAQRYGQYYPFQDFPHWALIDPRTGKRVRSGSRVLKAPEMLMELVEYVAEHPLAPPPRPSSVGKRESPSPTGGAEASVSTEEIVSPMRKKSREAPATPPVLPEEPPSSHPTCLTIQFRLPDGSRHRRRFLQSDPVQILYDFVSTTLGLHQDEFEIHSHTQSLSAPHFQDPLEQHQLKNATLTVTPK